MDCLPQSLKSTFFEFFWSGGYPKWTQSEEKIQKMLILFFEVIVQPPKHVFEIEIFSRFSSLCIEIETKSTHHCVSQVNEKNLQLLAR